MSKSFDALHKFKFHCGTYYIFLFRDRINFMKIWLGKFQTEIKFKYPGYLKNFH